MDIFNKPFLNEIIEFWGNDDIYVKWHFDRFDLNYDEEFGIINVFDKIVSHSNFQLLNFVITEYSSPLIAKKYFLQKAMFWNRTDIFLYILQQKPELNDHSILYYAINRGKYGFAKTIVPYSGHIDTISQAGRFIRATPLSCTVNRVGVFDQGESIEFVDFLLANGANPLINLWQQDTSVSSTQNPELSNYEIIELVNSKPNFDLLQLLVRYGINIQYFNCNRYLNENFFSLDVISFFDQNNYNFSNFFDNYRFGFENDSFLIQTEKLIQDAPFETVRHLLKKSNFLGKHDLKLLFYAGMAGRLDIIRLLLSLGADASAIRPKSLAKIFFANAPEYRTWTLELLPGESIQEAWYGPWRERAYWNINDNRYAAENDQRVVNMSINFLASFESVIVHELIVHGASKGWHSCFQDVLREMIVMDKYVASCHQRGRNASLQDLARDGWNAAFEIDPSAGEFYDYV